MPLRDEAIAAFIADDWLRTLENDDTPGFVLEALLSQKGPVRRRAAGHPNCPIGGLKRRWSSDIAGQILMRAITARDVPDHLVARSLVGCMDQAITDRFLVSDACTARVAWAAALVAEEPTSAISEALATNSPTWLLEMLAETSIGEAAPWYEAVAAELDRRSAPDH